MNKNKQIILENTISQIVNNTIDEVKKNQLIHTITEQAIKILGEDEHFNKKMNDRREDDKENSKKKKSKRSFVLNKLNNSGIVQADAMRSIWTSTKGSPEDDINRSLFSKMVTGQPDNDGVVRHFSDQEITSLAQYIHDIGS